jgi:DNA-binding CsgD family transcriptional regulator
MMDSELRTTSSERVIDLIDHIYSTVEAPSHWPDTVARIARETGAPRGLLFTPHHGPDEGGLWHAYNLTPEELDDYVRYYHQTDLWTQRAFERRVPTELAVDCDRIVDPAELQRSEFYNDYLKGIDIQGCLGVMFEGGEGTFPRVHLSVYRPNGSDTFDPEAETIMQALAPHLHRALDLGFRFAALRSRDHGKLEALNHLDFGVAGLDQDGSIAFMNDQAERILAEQDGLHIRHGCIIADNHPDNEQLWTLLRNTIGAQSKATRSSGGWTAVSRPSGRRAYAVTVAPGVGIPTVAGIPAAWALVFISDPETNPELPAERLARLYGLTQAEAQLAAALASGVTLNEYAESNALSLHTVRWTLKQIYAKTGTRRQAELVRLMLTTVSTDTKSP